MSYAKREVARIRTPIKKLLNLMLDDEIAVDEGKAEMKALDSRRKELEAQLKMADEPPPLPHPEMAHIYRTKVRDLAKALQQPEGGLEATETLRGLVDAIAQVFSVLNLEHVYGAIAHYLAHRDELDRYLAGRRRDFAAARQAARDADPMFYRKLAEAKKQTPLVR